MKVRLLVLICLAMAGAVAASALNRQQRFPHQAHERLFPLCTGCHEGVPQGNAGRFYPSPQLCAGCHNGAERARVSWTAPQPSASNLKFSHPQHSAVSGADIDCSVCHTQPGTSRMAVVRAAPERCFSCHAHQATGHFVDAPCQQCHVPLAQTTLPTQRIAALPLPQSHQQPGFLERVHGELARTQRAQCVVCHTRERCAACHVDAAARAEIQALPAAQPQLALPAMNARYFVPESHKQPGWINKHDGAARNIANCSACHTRESCLTCHAGNAPKPVMALPTRQSVAAPGVTTVRRAPASHAAPFFAERHGAQAASRAATCTSCHLRTECEQCHNAAATGRQVSQRAPTETKPAPSQPSASGVKASAARPVTTRRAGAFHPSNFLARHASAAYGRNLECANCHETTRFCRACHEQSGMGTSGARMQPGFHDAQPFWLLNHGKPARQGLESCASCHKQTDCMQCHSQLGSFRISPHGPGFDPKRVQSKNARICFACHLGDPLTGSSP